MRFNFTLTLLICLACWSASAQNRPGSNNANPPQVNDNDSMSVDLSLLVAPATAAATLLGFSPSEIDKPRDPSALLASFANSTNNLTTLPTNYAVELAPAWMYRSKNITFKDFTSNALPKNIWQSLTISAGVRNNGTSSKPDSLTQVSFGLKTSILRGHLPKSTDNLLKRTQAALDHLTQSTQTVLNNDSIYQELLFGGDDKALIARQAFLYQQINEDKADVIDSLTNQMSRVRFDRVGVKLDFTAGVVIDYADARFSNSSTSKVGAWLTGGYDGENGISVLLLARYLSHPSARYLDESGDVQIADLTSFDAGARLIYAPSSSRFALSGEAIYRSYSELVDPTWRVTVNAEYRIRQNHCLTFTYGRAFDGTVTKGGNVVAALSMFAGFGSEKNMKIGKN